MKRHIVATFAALAVVGLCLLTVTASAQEPPTGAIQADSFKISYFSNNGVAGAPDATVRLDNPGSAPGDSGDLTWCAMIYVFDNDQQLSECCGCLLTPDGLRTLSVTHDLTSNPLTGTVSNNGAIKIVNSIINAFPICDPTGEEVDPVIPVPTVRAWASHVQNKVGTAYPITETAFTDATLSEEELSFNLEKQCSFARRLGSGKAVCSCGTGD